MTFAPFGKVIATASMDTTAKLYDIETSEEISWLEVCMHMSITWSIHCMCRDMIS